MRNPFKKSNPTPELPTLPRMARGRQEHKPNTLIVASMDSPVLVVLDVSFKAGEVPSEVLIKVGGRVIGSVRQPEGSSESVIPITFFVRRGEAWTAVTLGGSVRALTSSYTPV